MKIKTKLIILSLSFLLVSSPAFAEIEFSDVPADHWARWAVNDLVKLGVTQGYPDGTFRGNRNITRYETAIFLAKLAQAIGEGKVEDVDLSGLREDIKALKDEIAALRDRPADEIDGIPLSGSFVSRFRVGNLFAGQTASGDNAPKGPRVDYRLKTTLAKNLGRGASVAINLDTMDAGYNGGEGDLATKLIDVEGKLKLDPGFFAPVEVKVTAGPGPVTYFATADAVLPSEVGTVYMRPRNSIMVSTMLGGADLETGYIARSISPSGEVSVDHITATLGYNFDQAPIFGKLRLAGTWDYVVANLLGESGGEPNDSRGRIFLGAEFNPVFHGDLTYGFSQGEAGEGTHIGLGFVLLDPWNTGTTFMFNYHRVGREYLVPALLTAEADMIGLDYFDKYLTNGIIDIGGGFSQILAESFIFTGKFDHRFDKDLNYGEEDPLSSTTVQIRLGYKLAENSLIDFIYMIHQVPSNVSDKSSDVFALAFLFKF